MREFTRLNEFRILSALSRNFVTAKTGPTMSEARGGEKRSLQGLVKESLPSLAGIMVGVL